MSFLLSGRHILLSNIALASHSRLAPIQTPLIAAGTLGLQETPRKIDDDKIGPRRSIQPSRASLARLVSFRVTPGPALYRLLRVSTLYSLGFFFVY